MTTAMLVSLVLNSLSLAALYFIVASGFSLVFGLLRTVNMAHGAMCMLGAYVGYDVASRWGWGWGVLAAAVATAVLGMAVQKWLLDRMAGQDLRQALLTIGLAIVLGDQMLARYGGTTYQMEPPEALYTSVTLPLGLGGYPMFRLFMIGVAVVVGLVLWLLLHRTRLGMAIRAGVDDRAMLSAMGFNVPLLFVVVFGLGAALAGLGGAMGGSALSVAPGEDARYLMSSLVVVIVGGMGSLAGAALGALLIAFAEQIGLILVPHHAILLTFVLMAAVLAVRPSGLLGRA
ncbi:MAG: branched-chain amino acid ABC transporter permease [Pseudacidovorax sp.]|nr:branched-chain amino acid ABC transporter permease [Pseudacidovorax sp.]